jgi:hypothetical protein
MYCLCVSEGRDPRWNLECLLILVWQNSESVVVGILESGPFLRGGISYRVSRPVSYASQLKLLVRAPASQGVQGSDWHKLGMSFTGWRSYLEVEAWSIHSFHADLA